MGHRGDPGRALPARPAVGALAPHETPRGTDVTASIAAYISTCLAMVWVERALARHGSTDATPRAKLSDQLMVLGTTAALITGVASAALGLGGVEPRWLAFGAGVLLGLAGIFLRGVAMSTLGRFYSLTPQVEKHQAIVTAGPYRLTRA